MNSSSLPCKAQRGLAFTLILVFSSIINVTYCQGLLGSNPDIHVSGYGDHSAYIQKNPIITSNGKDGFMAAWSDSRDGYCNLWAQYFDQNGVAIGENFSILDSPAIKNIKYFHSAMGNNGNVMVIWNDFLDLYAKCYSPDHSVLTNEFKVCNSSVFESSFTLTKMPDGSFMAAYFKSSGKGLFLNKYNEDGSENGAPVQVYTGDGYEYPNMIIKPSTDLIYLSWYEASSSRKHFIMSLDYDLNIIGQPTMIREGDYSLPDYGIGLSSDQKLEIYYKTRPGSTYEIARSVFNRDCSLARGEVVVSPEYIGNYSEPRVLKRTGSSTLLAVLCHNGQLASFSVSDSNVPSELNILGDDFGHFFMNTQKSQLSVSGNSDGNMMLVFKDYRHYFSEGIPTDGVKHSLEDDCGS